MTTNQQVFDQFVANQLDATNQALQSFMYIVSEHLDIKEDVIIIQKKWHNTITGLLEKLEKDLKDRLPQKNS